MIVNDMPLVTLVLRFFGEDSGTESISSGGGQLTLKLEGVRASLLMVVVVWYMGCGQVIAAGLEDGTLSISKVPLFICNSAPENLLHCHKNS